MSRSTAVRGRCGLSCRHVIGVVRPSAPRQDAAFLRRLPVSLGLSATRAERGPIGPTLEKSRCRLQGGAAFEPVQPRWLPEHSR
jgi:hypothetical protein